MRFLIKAIPLFLGGSLGLMASPPATSAPQNPLELLIGQKLSTQTKRHVTPPAAPGTAKDQSRDPPMQLFVSFSMGMEVLKELKARSWPKGTRWVFQGLPPGISLVEFSRKIQSLGPTPGDPLMVEIDPIAFQRLKIVAVPTRVEMTAGDAPAIHVGATHPDLDGKNCPTFNVLESPMDTLIRSRLQAFNWKSLKERQIKEAWIQIQATQLPIAKVTRTMTLKPHVQSLNPLKGPHGNTLFPANKTYPLWPRILSDQRLIILDGSSSERWDQILTALKERKSRTTHLLVTHLESENLSLALKRIKDRFGLSAKPLPKEYPERLGLQAVPAIVELDSDEIIITEIGPPA